MNPLTRHLQRWLVFVTLVIALGSASARQSALPSVQLWQIAREVPGAEPRWQRVDGDRPGVRVWRGGREIAVQRMMLLQPGDEVETGQNVAAVLRFRDAGDTLVLNGTRVRIGSLEVLFGRVFAVLRNRFTVSSQTVVAGVEGTRFLFEVGRDRAVHVAVADGVVVCSSPQGAWAPVRLRTHEGLRSRYPGRGPPVASRTDVRELRAYEAMALAVSRAQPPNVNRKQ